MMTPLLLLTILIAQPEEIRVPIACSVSKQARRIAQGTKEVTAVRCSGRKGFFVPSDLYRELRKYEMVHPFHLEEIGLLNETTRTLELANASLAATASASEKKSHLYKDAYREEKEARREAEQDVARKWYENDALWFGVGALATTAIFFAVAEFVPDRIIASP